MKTHIHSFFTTHQTWFGTIVAVLLIATAIAKTISAFGDVQILDEQDPLFPFFSQRAMLVIAAVLELGVAGYLLRSKHAWRKALLVAWLGTVLLGYRIGLWAVGYDGSCSCLGHLADPLGVPPTTSDSVMKAMLAYFLVFSYGPLVRTRFRKGTGKRSAKGIELGAGSEKA